MNKKRMFLFRLLTVVILLAICATMMVIGRGHTVYFDNKTLEYDGNTYKTPYKVEVNVKGERVAKLYDKERGMVTTMGQKFTMELAVTQEQKGKEVTSSYTLELPYNMDGIAINLPALLAGLPQDVYLSEFVSTVVEEEPSEEATDEFGADGLLEGMDGM